MPLRGRVRARAARELVAVAVGVGVLLHATARETHAGLASASGDEARLAAHPPTGLRAGAAVAPIAVEAGDPLAGWSARGPWNRAEGTRDLVEARALVLETGAGRPRLGLVTLDVFLTWPELRAALASASRDLGLDALTLVATGTRSGPGGYVRSLPLELALLGRRNAASERAVLEAADRALRQAAQALEPARIGSGEARAPGISRNAEREGGIVDERVPILRVDSVEGAAIATLFAFAAEPAVLSAANHSFSPDYPRHARRRIEAVRGGVAIWLPGPLAGQAPQRGGLERRRGDVGFEVEVATEIGNALGLVVAAAVPMLAVSDTSSISWRAANLGLPPPGWPAPCPLATLARAWRALPGATEDSVLRAAIGQDATAGAPLMAWRIGSLRVLFAPFSASAGVAARLRERAGDDVLLVSLAQAWLGNLHLAEELASSDELACRQLFGAGLADAFLAVATELVGALR